MVSNIVEYSSSSDDDEDDEFNDYQNSAAAKNDKPTLKRTTPAVLDETADTKRLKPEPSVHKLPVPSAIQSLYADKQTCKGNNSEDHSGKVRSFPHVEGNWATFVYIPVARDERLTELFLSLINCLRPLAFELSTDYHVTLSRTVVIRHHWIQSLMDSLRENLSVCKTCICDVRRLKLLTNDEKTRTFLCLEVFEEGKEMLSLVKAVDNTFREFELQPYYKNPSFHISFAWCVGDVKKEVSEQKMGELQNLAAAYLAINMDLSVLEVSQVECKAGNKMFRFSLDSDHSR